MNLYRLEYIHSIYPPSTLNLASLLGLPNTRKYSLRIAVHCGNPSTRCSQHCFNPPSLLPLQAQAKAT